jgi:hypothetical protein
MTMTLIETKTLGTAAAQIEFTSIPQTYTDLLFLVSGRSSNTGDVYNNLFITVNGTSSGYSERLLYGNGSAVGSVGEALTRFRFFYISTLSATSNTFGSGQLYIPNYAGATNKSMSSESVAENNGTATLQSITAHLWSNTAAITTVRFALDVGNLVVGSTISLYGILKGTDGIVVVS